MTHQCNKTTQFKEACGFHIWGQLFSSIWANVQRTAGRLGTNEKEMIWNIHALLPANLNATTWQVFSLLPRPDAPTEMCLHTVLSSEQLQDGYSSLALGSLACLWVKARLCCFKLNPRLHICFPFCVRNTADILSGWAFESHNFSPIATFGGQWWGLGRREVVISPVPH